MDDFLVPKNNAYSTLDAGINNAVTEFVVAAGEGALFPSTYPYHVTIDDEILHVTNRSTDTFTCTRGAESTTPAAHATAATVELLITAQAMSEIQDAIEVAFSELTIATGVITVTQRRHSVDTESDAASDDLDTINGGLAGMVIVLRAENDARTVVVKHNTGNIWLQGKADVSLDDIRDAIMLCWDGTKWVDISAGGGGAGAVATDAIWDAKGDLAVGTGANTAQKLTVGANGLFVVADSGEATGLKYLDHNATTGVHGVGANYIAEAPAASHLVRTFSKGWTSGKMLKGGGVDTNPTEITGWEVLAETIVSGSAVTYVEFTGLDINTHKTYLVYATVYNSAGTPYDLKFYVEADYTDTNYYSQYLQGDGATAGAGRQNAPHIAWCYNGESCLAFMTIMRDPQGYARCLASVHAKSAAGVLINYRAACKVATVANITAIRFTSPTASGIGIGSRFTLVRQGT